MTNTEQKSVRKNRKRPPPRKLSVIRKAMVTPNMLRVTLGGPELAGFPEDADGGYVKLRLGMQDDDKPLVRTYTVRKYDSKANEIEVDFVVHESEGPAANWAVSCEEGDQIQVGGPGPRKSLDSQADWFLLVGDMSALPAISVNLERLHPNAKGYALLEVIHADDRQDLNIPPGIKVDWIVNSDPEQANEILFNAVKALHWLDGQPSVWVAGELSQSLAIRTYLKSDRGVTAKQMYASSYWQIGHTEDGHRISKQNIES
ncbi:MAG: siderophore-interacting protein [Gammaproteobacteria bacterium]